MGERGCLVETTGCPHIDFSSDEARIGLNQMVSKLRSDNPVAWTDAHDGYWVLTRYKDIVRVFQDWETFTSTEGAVVPRIQTPLRALPMESDPPEQRAYRQSLNPHLAPAAVALLEPSVRAIVVGLIDEFISDGRCDLVEQLAQHVSSRVLFRLLLHADEADIAMCHQWVKYFAYEPTSERAAEAALELMQFCYKLVSQRREGSPRGDILDSILGTEVNGEQIDDVQALGIVALLIFGGFDTTASLIASSVLHLAQLPDLQASLRDDPTRIRGCLDEFFRLDPPVIGLARRATRDVEIDGHQLRNGDAVYLSVFSANRDPAEFDKPDELIPGRTPNRHLAFSAGVHRCVGSNLGKLMLRVTLEEVLARCNNIRLDGPIDYYQGAARGLRQLPVAFTPTWTES
jgi:cytochrome P450